MSYLIAAICDADYRHALAYRRLWTIEEVLAYSKKGGQKNATQIPN